MPPPHGLPGTAAPTLLVGVLGVGAAGAAAVASGGGVLGLAAGAAALVLGGAAVAAVHHVHGGHARRAAALRRLAVDLRAGSRPDADAMIGRLGEDARPLLELAAEADAARAARDEATALARALLHLGPHYALLLRLDGALLEANPAFWARTGLTPAALRADPGALGRLLPLPTILDLAERSLRENVGLSGIPLHLKLSGEDRAVALSLRAVRTADGPVATILLADRTHECDLERQVEGFSDALELMVDQRVARLTAGRAALEEMLEEAGLAVFVFDRHGAVERMNAAAERLTGRTQFTLRQFGQVVLLLAEGETTRNALHAWFWQGGGAPLATRVPSPRGGVRMTWHTSTERRGGEVLRRLLVGAPEPPPGGMEGGLHALASALGARERPRHVGLPAEEIREAARRIGKDEAAGDGASFPPAPAPPDSALGDLPGGRPPPALQL